MVRSFPSILVLFRDRGRRHLSAITPWEAFLLVPAWSPVAPATAAITNGEEQTGDQVPWLRLWH
jgi:hypothetical protein